MGGFVNNLKRIGGAFLPPPDTIRTPPFVQPGTSTAPGMRPPIPELPPQMGGVQGDDGSPAPEPMRPPQVQQQAPPPPIPQMLPSQAQALKAPSPIPQVDETENATPQAPSPQLSAPPPVSAPAPMNAPPQIQGKSAPPVWGDQAARAEQARKELEAIQRPIAPEPKGVRKYVGAFLQGGLPGLASEAIRPGAAYAQQKYRVDLENAGNKYALEKQALGDAVTEASRQSQIEYRTEQEKIARERIAEVKSKTYQGDLKMRIGKREEDATYQKEGDPRPEGTEYIPNDEKSGSGWVVPAAYSPLPKELTPFLAGHKEGQMVPYSKIKQAQKDYNAAQLVSQRADLKPDKENPNQWIALAGNPDPAISGPAKDNLKRAAAQAQAGRPITNNTFSGPPAAIASLPTGEVTIDHVPERMRGLAASILRYDQVLPTLGRKNEYTQELAYWVNKVDPAYDAKQFPARSALEKSATSGPIATNNTSVNTAIGHLGSMYDNVAKLDNQAFKKYNTLGNYILSEKGNPRLKPFIIDRTAVSEELARAFKGGVATLEEVKQWEQNINTSDSPAALYAAIREVTKVLGTRIQAQEDTYTAGMGRPPKSPFIRKRSQDVLDRMSDRSQGVTQGGTQGGGITVTDPKGGIHTFPNQASADSFKKLIGVK